MTVPACAFAGAVVTVAVVYRVSRVGKSTPVTTLILAGVAVGAFASAATSFVMLLKEDQIHRVIYFLWGGFGLGGWKPVRFAPAGLGDPRCGDLRWRLDGRISLMSFTV